MLFLDSCIPFYAICCGFMSQSQHLSSNNRVLAQPKDKYVHQSGGFGTIQYHNYKIQFLNSNEDFVSKSQTENNAHNLRLIQTV